MIQYKTMFDIGWTEILILATVSLFVIGPKEIPKFLGYLGKMFAKIKGYSRELQDTVDDAIKNSELEDIRKEISFTDPELSKNLTEILTPATQIKEKEKNSNVDENKKNVTKSDNINQKNDISDFQKQVTQKDLPTGLKHIRNDTTEDENNDNIEKNKS